MPTRSGRPIRGEHEPARRRASASDDPAWVREPTLRTTWRVFVGWALEPTRSDRPIKGELQLANGACPQAVRPRGHPCPPYKPDAGPERNKRRVSASDDPAWVREPTLRTTWRVFVGWALEPTRSHRSIKGELQLANGPCPQAVRPRGHRCPPYKPDAGPERNKRRVAATDDPAWVQEPTRHATILPLAHRQDPHAAL